MPETQSAIGPLRTPPVVQGSVIALRTAGKSKRSIARELGIDRKTVDNVLEAYQVDQPNYTETIHKLTTSAFSRVATAIENEKDTDTARWALERTALRSANGPVAHQDDHSLNIAVGFVPSGTSTASTPSLPSTTSTPTEAPQKDRLLSVDLSKHENFSQIPDSALLAELERRGYRAVAKVIEATDAEIIESNG